MARDRILVFYNEPELRAGKMSQFVFGPNWLWLYFEPTRDGVRFMVELWENQLQVFKHPFESFAEAAADFEATKINHAVAIAMEAFDLPRGTLQ